jgi:hypothetical protein
VEGWLAGRKSNWIWVQGIHIYMRKQCILMVPALAIGLCALFTPVPLNAQSENAAQEFQQLATQMALSPDQKSQLIPVLVAEAPKVKAIKADSSHADSIHQELQTIRRQELRPSSKDGISKGGLLRNEISNSAR